MKPSKIAIILGTICTIILVIILFTHSRGVYKKSGTLSEPFYSSDYTIKVILVHDPGIDFQISFESSTVGIRPIGIDGLSVSIGDVNYLLDLKSTSTIHFNDQVENVHTLLKFTINWTHFDTSSNNYNSGSGSAQMRINYYAPPTQDIFLVLISVSIFGSYLISPFLDKLFKYEVSSAVQEHQSTARQPPSRLTYHERNRLRIESEILTKEKDVYKCYECNKTIEFTGDRCPNCDALAPVCVICLKDPEGSEDVIYFTCCRSYAHKEHAIAWLAKSPKCPYCKTPSPDYKPVEPI